MTKIISLLILVLFLLFIVNTLSSISAEDKNCASVFAGTCAECHELDRGCELLGQSQKEWKELFEYMEEMGADISKDEQTLLSNCLNKPDDETKAECK